MRFSEWQTKGGNGMGFLPLPCLHSLAISFALAATSSAAQSNLNSVPTILKVPPVMKETPAAGKRVSATTEGWQGTEVYHALYLPTDWKPEAKWPVIVEYPGNGGFTNKLGDTSDGSVNGCVMGYGLSGARGFIWVSMPFVGADKSNATKWWGDVEETKRYCMATVRGVCQHFGGDPSRVVLMGFSRGAIACNYIGLHDDVMAQLWCGMICHSHYDGVFKHPAADYDAWPQRLQRLGKKSQFISHEKSTQKIQNVIATTGVPGDFTFAVLPYENHSVRWTLCDLPLRTQAREFLLRTARVTP
jgi:hypothetical protein